jgi:L-cystine uptake protein TcyP (sodium:dicarboxylate symporter family)
MSIFCLINLIYLRTKFKILFGHYIRIGNEERKKIKILTSSRNLLINILIIVLLAINLDYAVVVLSHLDDHELAHELLIYGTGFVILLIILIIPIVGYKVTGTIAEIAEIKKAGKR